MLNLVLRLCSTVGLLRSVINIVLSWVAACYSVTVVIVAICQLWNIIRTMMELFISITVIIHS